MLYSIFFTKFFKSTAKKDGPLSLMIISGNPRIQNDASKQSIKVFDFISFILKTSNHFKNASVKIKNTLPR